VNSLLAITRDPGGMGLEYSEAPGGTRRTEFSRLLFLARYTICSLRIIDLQILSYDPHFQLLLF
jgi:hypothetical protein